MPQLAPETLLAKPAGAAELRAAPTVWILWHRRMGDYKQMLALAHALEWPWTAKRLAFRSAGVAVLAPWLLDRMASDELRPPWPDIVLCAEALCVPIARKIRRWSGNRTKIVVIGRPPDATAAYDLVLTTAQYRLPSAPNVVELDLPLALEAPPGEPVTSLDLDPNRPVTAVLIGASSAPDWLDADVADAMSEALDRHARQTGGTLLIALSPRTEPAVAEVLLRHVHPPHWVLAYREAPDNPYWDLIRTANEIVVTSDSVSMVADAIAAGKTVYVYELPRRQTLTFRLSEWLYDCAIRRDSVLSRSVARLLDSGLVEVTADRRRLFAKLAAEGRLSWFGEGPPAVSGNAQSRNVATAVAKVKELCAR